VRVELAEDGVDGPRRHGARRPWPGVHRALHLAAIPSALGALASGLMLSVPAWHTPLIPYLSAIYWLHAITGGALLAAAAATVVPAPPSRRLRSFDWAGSLVLTGAVGLTGLVVGAQRLLPAGLRAIAQPWHGLFALALLLWIGLHVYRLGRGRGWLGRQPAPLAPGRRLDRRAFLGWLGGGAVAATLLPSMTAGWAAEGDMGLAYAVPGSLPGFQVYSVSGSFPPPPPDGWRIGAFGLVASPRTFSLNDLRSLPQTDVTRPFQCVAGWVVPSARWRGVAMADLLARLSPAPGARYVTLYSADGTYTESLSLEEARRPDVLLALEADGRPLPSPNGGPVRLVVPPMYGYKSIKWVNGLLVVSERHLGYWEVRGYPADAWLPGARPRA
jgi:hypothetical protein